VLGSTAFLPTTEYDTRLQFADAVTFLHGPHAFKFGGEYSRLYANQQFGFNQFGTYTLGVTTPFDTVLGTLASARSWPGSSLILGRFDSTASNLQKQIGNLQAAYTVHELSFFAQDQWRINRHLTLDGGVRVEQQFNPSPDANNTDVVNAVKSTIFPIRGSG